MNRPILTLLACALSIAILPACNQERTERTLPFPELIESGPFPELTEGGRRAQQDQGAGQQSAFERAISRVQEGESATEEAPTIQVQTVSLAGRLVADIPLRFDEWQWASSSHRTVIVHQLTGESPDAIVIVEPFGALMNRFPSQELRRFQNGLDPTVAGGIDPIAMAFEQLALADPEVAAQAQAISGAFRALNSPTYGLGIGYQTTPKSFTGWRWIGKNHHDITLRMARSRGLWGPQPPPGRDVVQSFEVLARNAPEFEEHATYMAELQQHLSQNQLRTPIRTSYMIVGNATADGKTGLHFTIICEASPRCPVARELADFLSSVRAPGPGESLHLRPQGVQDPDEFARERGIHFAHPDNVMNAEQLGGIIQRLSF